MKKLLIIFSIILLMSCARKSDEKIITDIEFLLPPGATNVQVVKNNWYIFYINEHKYLGFFREVSGDYTVDFERIE